MHLMKSLKHLVVDVEYLYRLICTICNEVMVNPTQTSCGCRYCLECIEKRIMTHEETITCTNCLDQNIERSGLVPDKAVEKEIMNLTTKCPNKGCPESMLVKHLKDHVVKCDYRIEQCLKCQQWYQHCDRQHHETEQCSKTVIVCDECNEEMTREDLITKHKNYDDNLDNICTKWMAICPYKCDDVTLVNVRIHVETCFNRPIKCALAQIGCHVTGSRDAISKHVIDDHINHQLMLTNEIQKLRSENVDIKKMFRTEAEKFEIEKDGLKRIISMNKEEIRTLTMKIDKLKINVDSLESELKIYKSGSNSDPVGSLRDLVLNSDCIIWTITDFREKIRDARTRSVDHMISDHFYLTRPGYNMTLKVYPNGDGRAKNTHVSVFFVINKGEYDDQISWPFRSTVSLGLLSNNPNINDITVRMRPDNNATCYGRPISDHNVGAGQPEFVRQSDIFDSDHFLHNGAVKLKLSVYPH